MEHEVFGAIVILLIFHPPLHSQVLLVTLAITKNIFVILITIY